MTARPARSIGLGLILLALAVSFATGLLIKAPCAAGDWTGQQYTKLCYTDIIPLFGTEHLDGPRLPYLDPCPEEDQACDEYPVLTMYSMRIAAWGSSSAGGFFALTAVLLALAGVATATGLYVIVGTRALLFALAPTLIIYATVNWDLYAVALATGATVLYLRRRDGWAGVLLGLGAAMKFYPALLIIPFVAGRFQEKEPDGGIHLAWGAVGTWLGVNLPFAILAPDGWLRFFRFNGARPPDWDSLWFISCHRITGNLWCPEGMTKAVNLVSGAAFLALVALAWWRKARREPTFPRWQLAFPVIALFLLTNKVYSPQYGLWLLPLFALLLPDLRLFIAFEFADIAVFVTRFSFFGQQSGVGGLGFGWFEIAIAVRAALLIACVFAWVRRPSEQVPLPERSLEEPDGTELGAAGVPA